MSGYPHNQYGMAGRRGTNTPSNDETSAERIYKRYGAVAISSPKADANTI